GAGRDVSADSSRTDPHSESNSVAYRDSGFDSRPDDAASGGDARIEHCAGHAHASAQQDTDGNPDADAYLYVYAPPKPDALCALSNADSDTAAFGCRAASNCSWRESVVFGGVVFLAVRASGLRIKPSGEFSGVLPAVPERFHDMDRA